MSEPEKFIKGADGVRRLNPAWSQWKKQHDGGGAAPAPAPAAAGDQLQHHQHQAAAINIPCVAPQAPNAYQSLPVVTSISDQQYHLPGSSVCAATQHVAQQVLQQQHTPVGLTSGDAWMTQLNHLFAKYEVPAGLLGKLLRVAEYQGMCFVLDDSGSMNTSIGAHVTRWDELRSRILQILEVLSCLPCPPIVISFLNRPALLNFNREQGESPQRFFDRMASILNAAMSHQPAGTTPFFERIQQQFKRNAAYKTMYYFAGDGQPNGGEGAIAAITKLVQTRSNPKSNPVTFFSCSENDADVEWMKTCEECSPFCSEVDDYQSEFKEVLTDQGTAMPYPYGTYLVSAIVGATDPEMLDAMDEGAPFTLSSLSELLGYDLPQPEYQFYFNEFLRAQAQQAPKRQRSNDKTDKIKLEYSKKWPQLYSHFVSARQSSEIPVVAEYRQKLIDVNSSSCVVA